MTEWVKSDEIIVNVVISCEDRRGQRCPYTHPFAYDNGNNCCANPFEDVNDDFGSACDGSPISIGLDLYKKKHTKFKQNNFCF